MKTRPPIVQALMNYHRRYGNLCALQKLLNTAILLTPTGELRNKLTEVNILVFQEIHELSNAVREAQEQVRKENEEITT